MVIAQGWVTVYPYETSCAVLWCHAVLVSHMWQLGGSLEILLCSTSEGVQMQNSTVGSPGEVSRWWEEAQHMSLVLRLPQSHRRGAKASQTQETWNNVWFPDWETYSVSPPTYIHVLEIKSDIYRKNHSMLLAVHPWYQPTTVCPFIPIWCGWTCIRSDAAVRGWWVTGVTLSWSVHLIFTRHLPHLHLGQVQMSLTGSIHA